MKQASTSRYCEFWKASNGKWYMDLASREYGDYEEATTYGPFASEAATEKYLDDNFSNPGATDTDDEGHRPPPTKSPNGRPVVKPDAVGRWASDRIADRYMNKTADNERWQYNFIVTSQKTLAVEVIAAENNGWRAELGITEGGKVIEGETLNTAWSRSFDGAVEQAKAWARLYKIAWQPRHYGTDKTHKPGTPPPG